MLYNLVVGKSILTYNLGIIMKAILFAILAVLSINASAGGNEMLHKKADGSVEAYSTYAAKDMKRSVENNWIFVAYRNCTKLSAAEVIKREKLAPNNMITGGMYCGGSNNSTTILVSDVRKYHFEQPAFVQN